MSETGPRLAAPPGLCASCVHARIVETARGSTFLLCGLSFSDSRFAKYPRLPVIVCDGYIERDARAG